MKEICCGIDLGTTNSVIAYLRDGVPEAVSIEEGQPIVPSMVSFDPENDQVFLGRQAANRLMAYPNLTVKSVKRLMGKDIPIVAGDKSYRPEDISSLIIRHLVREASGALGVPVKKVVITVPAYFDDAQRRATIRAGELAGVEVLRIINEPTAASLVYDGSDSGDADETVLVYDLGGGTFDVSILRLRGDLKEVLASCGDTALGGDDLDERLKDHFLAHLKEKSGTDLSQDFPLQVRLKDLAEKTKIALSQNPYVQVNEVGLTLVNQEPVNLSMEVSRGEFEEMTRDLIEKTRSKVREALEEADISEDELNRVILVGGSTRMPAVQEMLADMFDQPMEHSVDPDLCVALGAAVQAGIITGEPIRQILIDVSAHSLGVKTIDDFDFTKGEPDYFSTIIRRNTRIPVTHSNVYYTMVDNQERIKVEVYQGESISCRKNNLVGKFKFDLAPVPAGSAVTISFSYDLQGIVQVTVEQKGHENRKTVAMNVKDVSRNQEELPELREKPVNYVSQKARKLLEDPRLSPGAAKTLLELIKSYEDEVLKDDDMDRVDELEDRLLESLENLQEELDDLG